MLEMLQSIVPPQYRRPPGGETEWHAACEIDGKEYQAFSRHGAPYKLARVLVKAGVPDQPVEVVALCNPMGSETLAEMSVHYDSLHAMATLTLAPAPAGINAANARILARLNQ